MIFPCHFPACEDGQFFSAVRIYRPRFSHKNDDLAISWDIEALKPSQPSRIGKRSQSMTLIFNFY